MLLPREKKILGLLYEDNRELTTNELANTLHICSRTIKADIKKIKDELHSTGCMIYTKTGRGVWLEFNDKGKSYLENLLLNEEQNASIILPETRKYYIALQLLDADDYVSMERISESMYVSKGTVVNDVNKLEKYFKENGLSIEKKVKYGIRVFGSENQVRITKANVIRKIVIYQGSQIVRKLRPFFEEIDLNEISIIIQAAEEKFGFILSDASYSELLIHLSIIIRRIKKGKRCIIDNNELKIYKKMAEWPICELLADCLEDHYQIKLYDGDRSYILMNILGAKLQSESSINPIDTLKLRKTSPQTFSIWEKIIELVGDRYNENLSSDNTFKCALFVHLNAMFNRLRSGIHLENPLKRMIKDDLVYEFEVATYMAGLLFAEYNISLGEDEICDLAIYIGASLEREKATLKTRKTTVTVVCGTGMGTSQFIEAKLKLIFPELIIERILPISRIESEIEPHKQSFVISTVPLTIKGVNVINISPMLTDNDIKMIEEMINPNKNYNERTINGKYNILLSQMHENISIFKCDCHSKEEVIHLLGSRLIHEKYADKDFIESVFKRENLAPTSIGDTFAIPHAYAGHILKQGIALMTLKKPIEWGKEKVQIILMLSIDAKLKEPFRNIFNELANITKDVSAVEQIINANNFKDIIKIFK